MINFEQNKIDIINNIKTTMEMENQKLSNTDISMLEAVANNKITMDDAMNSIKNRFSINKEVYFLCTKQKMFCTAIVVQIF